MQSPDFQVDEGCLLDRDCFVYYKPASDENAWEKLRLVSPAAYEAGIASLSAMSKVEGGAQTAPSLPDIDVKAPPMISDDDIPF